MLKENISELKSFIESPKNIVIVGHKNPDGDAVGSCMGLALLLKKINHKAHVILPNEYPDFLNWVPSQENIILYSSQTEVAKEMIQNSDLIFTLDFNHLSRVGEEFQKDLQVSKKPFIMIDHHQEPDTYADITISHPEYGSTAELIYTCIEALGYDQYIDKDIASCLYLGIMTDTGSFKFSSTTARTHQIVSKLIKKGAEAYKIQEQTFDANTYSRLKLLGKALDNLEYIKEYHTAYISLTQDEMEKFNYQKGDTEGFVNYGLSIKDVTFAAIFKEDKQQNIIKISFRSKGNFDVNKFAKQHFNGGGHKNASGGRSEYDLNKTISKFMSLLEEYKTELNEAL